MPTDTATPDSSKFAVTDGNVHELIRTRWSPRAYSSREVSNEDLRSILEAGRWAASSYNEQPWRFFVVRKSDGSAFERFLGTLAPANQAWAASAPVLIIMASKKTFSHNGAANYYALHDTGQALAHVMLQATALGLHAHAMAGFSHEKAREVIGIPDDYDIGAAVVLGYLGNPEQLPQQARAAETAQRQRKPLRDIAFGSSWNEPLAL
jgi:nitroreductase